jgi:hypothetical protein
MYGVRKNDDVTVSQENFMQNLVGDILSCRNKVHNRGEGVMVHEKRKMGRSRIQHLRE